jgi:hypothetical protein
MTVGSTNWVKSLYQRLPKPSLRAAHTVCVKLQRPVPDVALRSSRYRQLQLGGGLSRFENYQNVGWTLGPGITILSRLRITITLPVLIESFDAVYEDGQREALGFPLVCCLTVLR